MNNSTVKISNHSTQNRFELIINLLVFKSKLIDKIRKLFISIQADTEKHRQYMAYQHFSVPASLVKWLGDFKSSNKLNADFLFG